MRQFLFLAAAGLAMSATTAAAQPQSCPLQGDAVQPLALELNPYKNREDAPPAAKINSNATLTSLLAPGDDLTRWSRLDGAIFEGVVVGVKIGGVETVNCHATDPAHRDTHIELALDPNAPEIQRVIVEVTPRWRQKMASIADWSTDALKQQLLGKRVRITGWLFDDLEHKGESENTNPGGAKNWRATVWEIHPITAIEVLPGAATTIAAPAPTPTTLPAPAHHRARPKKKCTRSGTHRCRSRSHRQVRSARNVR